MELRNISKVYWDITWLWILVIISEIETFFSDGNTGVKRLCRLQRSQEVLLPVAVSAQSIPLARTET